MSEPRHWLTADLHLGHARIIDLCQRPFPDVDTMNQALIARWNAVVQPDDTVWVLGDFALGPIDQSLALGRQMAGTKHLILGNHDRPFTRHGKPDEDAWIRRYQDEAGFGYIWRGGHTLDIGGRLVLLCHFPYSGDSNDRDRYADDRPADAGLWLLHGHVHEKWRIRRPERMINVGVDTWDFAPVRLTDVLALIEDRSEPR